MTPEPESPLSYSMFLAVEGLVARASCPCTGKYTKTRTSDQLVFRANSLFSNLLLTIGPRRGIIPWVLTHDLPDDPSHDPSLDLLPDLFLVLFSVLFAFLFPVLLRLVLTFLLSVLFGILSSFLLPFPFPVLLRVLFSVLFAVLFGEPFTVPFLARKDFSLDRRHSWLSVRSWFLAAPEFL